MENKICVYAICKNESQFVEKWLDSMSEADYIVVLDTGSEDDTYEKLKADPRVTRVEQKVISPWRFDVARNESLKLAPEDTTVYICTDLDEILHKGWGDALRSKWIPNFHVRANYKYIWSHTNTGEPGRVFWYNKIHDKNWIWKHPVHELLIPTTDLTDNYISEHTLSLWDDVTLEHFPDRTKSRGSYLPLLELRAEESPDDYYGLFYLSHEYYYRGFYDKSIDILTKIVNEYADKYSNLDKAAAYLFLGDDWRKKGDRQKALYFYTKGIEIEPTYRECYLNAAEIYNELRMYEVAASYVETALERSHRHFTWVERDKSYNEQPDDILSIAYYYIAMKDKNKEKKATLLKVAYAYMAKALYFDPNNERLLYNKSFIDKALKEVYDNGTEKDI